VSRQLDRSRYFAIVHGEFDDEVRYWQDGRPFDAHGCIVTAGSPDHIGPQQAVGEPARAPEAAAAPALDVGPLSEPRASPPAPLAPLDNPPRDRPAAGGEIDLERWLRGEVRYRAFALLAAVNRALRQEGDELRRGREVSGLAGEAGAAERGRARAAAEAEAGEGEGSVSDNGRNKASKSADFCGYWQRQRSFSVPSGSDYFRWGIRIR